MATRRPTVGTWTLEFIDKPRAEQLFDSRAQNRNVTRRRVDLYAKQMTDGVWTITHQGICLDCTGRLNDGQHRVKAIAESGLGQWVWVYREVEQRSGMPHFDRHQERSTVQSLQLAGLDTTKSLVAAARSILQDGKYLATASLISDERIWSCLEHNRDKIDAINKALVGAKQYGGATTIALLTRALWKWPDLTAPILRFAAVVSSGVAEGPQESAAIRFRDFAKTGSSGGCVMRQQLYYRGANALSAFVEGRSIARLSAAGEDPFVGCGIPAWTGSL